MYFSTIVATVSMFLFSGSLVCGAEVKWVSSKHEAPWQHMPSPPLIELDEPPVVFVKPSHT